MLISSSNSYSKSNLEVVEINTNKKTSLKDFHKMDKYKSSNLHIGEVIPRLLETV